MPGIARAVLLRAGLLQEERLAQERVRAADAVYLINSLSVRRVQVFDGQSVRQSSVGLRQLCAALDVPLPDGMGA